jgi:hypothetical protein
MKLTITQYLYVDFCYVRTYADEKRKAVNMGRISFTSLAVAFKELTVTEHIMWSFVHQVSLQSVRMCVNYW